MNRRTFLKGLMGIAGASVAAKIAHLEIPGYEPEFAPEEVLPEILDAPVTPDNPFCWVDLDGTRFALQDAQVDVRQEYNETALWGESWRTVIPTGRTWEISCRSYDLHPELMRTLWAQNKLAECTVGWGHVGRFAGQVYLAEYALIPASDQQVVCDFTLQGVNELRRL